METVSYAPGQVVYHAANSPPRVVLSYFANGLGYFVRATHEHEEIEDLIQAAEHQKRLWKLRNERSQRQLDKTRRNLDT
jgi:hypothetical protein